MAKAAVGVFGGEGAFAEKPDDNPWILAGRGREREARVMQRRGWVRFDNPAP